MKPWMRSISPSHNPSSEDRDDLHVNSPECKGQSQSQSLFWAGSGLAFFSSSFQFDLRNSKSKNRSGRTNDREADNRPFILSVLSSQLQKRNHIRVEVASARDADQPQLHIPQSLRKEIVQQQLRNWLFLRKVGVQRTYG